ncbi:leucine-rich repeat protein [Butyrivibrio sp. AD3002]|uniref:leucine-rich repeat protein n=1 Tax=Butyrivibrio sp. AD3002 TaxID=1280670 RepID=UPI0003B756C2|nr:leucine-rich repeat domain-containing protein [Butyrivibrio sp. AD3002]
MKTKRLFKNIMPLIMAVALFISALPVSGIKAKAAEDFTPVVSVKEKKITLQINQPVEGNKMGDVGIVKYTHYLDAKNTITFQESWIEQGSSLYFGNNDTFKGGHYYHYEVVVYAPKEDLSDFTIDSEHNKDRVVWQAGTVNSTYKGAHTIMFEGYVKASFKPPCDMGEYTLDLSKGSVKMDTLSGDIVYDTLRALREWDGSIYNKKAHVEGVDEPLLGYDLDKDESCDMYCDRDSDGNYIFGPYVDNSVKDQKKLYLSILSRDRFDNNKTRYYSAITIKLPEISETPSLNQGAPTMDLSKGSYFSNDTKNIGYFCAYYEACVEEGSVNAVEKSLTEVDVDLDKNGTWDITIVLTLDSAYKFVDMTITALPTSSIKTSITKSLSESKRQELDKAKYAYYGEATFVFPDEKPSTPPEEGKKEETGKVEKEEKAVKVEEPAPAHTVGEAIENGGASYTISSVDEGKEAVTYAKPESNKVASATIPDTITIDNKEYKVTEIAANAFKNNKKLKKITIGKNINKIGANAFFGCKNLKNIKFKTVLLTKKSVGKNAFKGVNAKAKAKVPKKVLKAYKKFLPGKGLNGKGQKITK